MPPGLGLGDDDLLQVVNDLLAHHDDRQLLRQFYQAATVATLRKRESDTSTTLDVTKSAVSTDGRGVHKKMPQNINCGGFYTYVLVPELPEDVLVLAGIAHESPLEEGYVENGRVEVDELKDEHFERQVVLKLRLRPVHF